MEKHAPRWNGIGYIQVYAPRQTRKPNGATI